ncbi:histone deacetylase family protein [Rhodobacter sp. Har01]|uniref:histone deacetylase family protein n=1 Tax=Rhodobacter sp. Har01 TaxID=2883999 RepID=UPI001D096079|nr:histone deacetylase family protein [Rhodobacter sp. Har01]MCB6178129.1 histone deacetylase family protein [Rhodobacter sp. Har01]
MLVFTSEDCSGHVNPPGHPERVERLRAVEAGLAGLAVERRECPLGEEAEVLRCHPAGYLAAVKGAVPEAGWAQLDGDTFLSPGSFRAAMRAVGGICAAVDAVVAGGGAAFVAGRPPGHHAEAARAMGFCLFGTVAIGAMRALDAHGLARVAIVDFDVHHGNGTQDVLWDEGRCLFASSHQMPLYPGSGDPSEVGAHCQVLNVPLRGGTGGAAMRAAYERLILPAVADWRPDLLLVSAGFDAHAADPLAGLEWEAADYAWLAARLWEVSGGRMVSTLEGGYDLDALAASVGAYVGELARRAA